MGALASASSIPISASWPPLSLSNALIGAFPKDFQYNDAVLSLDQEQTLVEEFAYLSFREFEFRGFLGKRRTVSFGWRYEVFRQAAQSRIITSAHTINQGSIPDLSKPEGDSDFYFVQADDPETAVPRIVDLVKTRIPQRFSLNPIHDIQVLCPMNRGGVGARSLNIELQAALNPAGDRKVERFGWTLAPGDKVMQIENDYDKDVYNGDIGYIDDVDPDASELNVSFDGRSVTYGFGELDT